MSNWTTQLPEVEGTYEVKDFADCRVHDVEVFSDRGTMKAVWRHEALDKGVTMPVAELASKLPGVEFKLVKKGMY